MRTTVVALVVPLFWAAACGPKSQIDPQSSVTLSGTIQTESGNAAPATDVKLIRHPDVLQAIGEVFVAVGTIGLACIAGRLDICSSFEDSTSGGNGGYSFAMRGADTQGSVGEALTFTAFAGCATGNCAVASDFYIQKNALTIPPMRFWTELGSLANDANNDVALSWPAVESSVGGDAAGDYRINLVTADGEVWWTQDAKTATSATIDRHVTQNQEPQWNVVAQRKTASLGTNFTVNWYSMQQDYPNQNQTPISSGGDCYTQGADGMPALLARPCPLTDGNMATKFVPIASNCTSGQTCPPINNWMIVDVGISHPLGLLVLYDVSVSSSAATVLIETSDDMMNWTMRAVAPATGYQTVTLNATAEFVRLRLSDPNAQWSASGNGEVAIFSSF
ncbi:MAG TPA: hypothetical protein VGL86_26745 [Polyangia bacterium]|jgi:hypothetical protein